MVIPQIAATVGLHRKNGVWRSSIKVVSNRSDLFKQFEGKRAIDVKLTYEAKPVVEFTGSYRGMHVIAPCKPAKEETDMAVVDRQVRVWKLIIARHWAGIRRWAASYGADWDA